MSTGDASQIPPGWDQTTVQEAARVIRGITFPATAKSDSSVQGTVVCLRTSNVQRKLEFDDVLHVPIDYVKRAEQWLQDGDTVISMANSYELVGKVALAVQPPRGTTIGGFIAIIRPSLLEPRFTHYQLASTRVQEQLRRKASHTVNISNLSLGAIHPTSLLVAPLPEQHRIVEAIESYFTRLDDAVATLGRVQRNLKRYRASVLKAAVEGQLVPTEAELARAEGRSYEPASVLLERILAERRRRWEEAELARMRAKGNVPRGDGWKAKYVAPVAPDTTELPDLPVGWCWASIDQLSHVVRNGYSKKPAAEGSVRILRISAVRAMSVDFEDARWLPGSPEDYASDLVHTGDLLFTRYNGSRDLVGVSGLVRAVDQPTVHPDKLIKVRFLDALLHLPYLELATNTGASRAFVESRTRTTAGQAGVSGSDIKQLPVPLPPVAEQCRIADESARLLSLADSARAILFASSAKAARLRQSILKWAFEGRLVDQDPTDEPASVLLEHIRATRESANGKPPHKQHRAKTRSATS